MLQSTSEFHKSNPELVWEAIQKKLQSNVNNEFKRGDIKKLTGIEEGSFTSVFQAMSEDQPGGAPLIKESLRGIK